MERVNAAVVRIGCIDRVLKKIFGLGSLDRLITQCSVSSIQEKILLIEYIIDCEKNSSANIRRYVSYCNDIIIYILNYLECFEFISLTARIKLK